MQDQTSEETQEETPRGGAGHNSKFLMNNFSL